MRSARTRACTFCRAIGVSVSPGCSIFSTAASSRSNASSIETICERHVEVARGRLRGRARLRRREARGHEERAQDLARLRAPRAHRPSDGRSSEARRQRVAPARERDADRLEGAGLLEVVAEAERQRVEQLLAERGARAARRRSGAGRKKLWCARRRIAQPRRGRALVRVTLTCTYRRRRARANASWSVRQVVFSRRRRGVRSRSTVTAVDALAEARRRVHQAAVLRDEAAAVEDEPVVGADEVRRRRPSPGCRRRAWRSSRAACRRRRAGRARR